MRDLSKLTFRAQQFINGSLTYPEKNALSSQESLSLCHTEGILEIRARYIPSKWYLVLPLGTYRFKNNTKQVNYYPNNVLQIFAEKTVTNYNSNPAELHSNYCIAIKEIEHRSRTTTIIAMKMKKKMNSRNLSRFHKFSGSNFKKKNNKNRNLAHLFLRSSQIQIQKRIKIKNTNKK